jgi:hypothetical protein
MQVTNIVTLAFDSRPRQGLVRLWAKREARESHLMLPGVQKSVKEWMNPHTPKWTPILGIASQRTPKSSKGNCKGQNPLDWKVLYIIGNLLKRRCLKWTRMTNLDI